MVPIWDQAAARGSQRRRFLKVPGLQRTAEPVLCQNRPKRGPRCAAPGTRRFGEGL
jgi:hypothetical protein